MLGKSIIVVNIKRPQEGGSTRTPGRRTWRGLRRVLPQDALVVPRGPVCNILVCEYVLYRNFADSSSSLHFMRTEHSESHRSKCANDPALDKRIRSIVQVLGWRLCLNSPNPLSRMNQTDQLHQRQRTASKPHLILQTMVGVE